MEDMKSIDERFEELFKELYGDDDEANIYEQATTVDSFRADPHATKIAIKRFEKLFNELYGDDDVVNDRIHSLLDSNSSNTVEED